MATLSAMFRLFDGYSSTIKKIMDQTGKATEKILGASKKTDGFNESLKRTGAAANVASTGLGRMVGTLIGLAGAQKLMDITDTYTNTNARLAMVTESLQEQKQLQNDIFAAADRARGSYTDMANAAAKLTMLAGDSFGSNQEAVAFAELLTKSLKVSGAGQTEQNSAFLQLTQAMTAGKLQGDEFRSIMENAPMVADAIATYMGRSKSELKDLSSQGLITADIIKGAMFAAADDINGKFSQMPMTFADVWQRIKNNAMENAGEIFESLNGALNSVSGQKLLNEAMAGFESLLGRVNGLIDAFARGDPVVRVFFATAILMAGLYAGKMFLAAGATMAAYWPLLLIAGGLAGVIYYLTSTGMTFEEVFGIIGAGLGALYETGFNTVGLLWNLFLSFAEFLANVLQNPLWNIVNLFINMGTSVMGILEKIAVAVDTIFGTSFASAISSFSTKIQAFGDSKKLKSYTSLDQFRMEYKDIGSVSSSLKSKGNSIGSFIDNWDFSTPYTGSSAGGVGSMDFSQFATAGNPATVKGTGKGGAVKVENEEDLEWMRRLAERDYVARIAQNTLAPNIHVEFSGPITKEADTDRVMERVNEQLKDIIATAPEGVPT